MSNRISNVQFSRFRDLLVDIGGGMTSVSTITAKKKSDGSVVTNVDVINESRILAAIAMMFPRATVLAEESGCVRMRAGTMLWSIDPLDGSATYLAGGAHYSISAAALCEGVPSDGFVVQPGLGRAFSVRQGDSVEQRMFRPNKRSSGMQWKPLEVIENRHRVFDSDVWSHSPAEYVEDIERLKKAFGVRSVVSAPAVHGAMEVLTGAIDFYISPTAHHWDLAAACIMLRAGGRVVECLDGSEIDWRVKPPYKLPPVILAKDRKVAQEVRTILRIR